ncbi:MAG TPA: hypothetical protein VGT61_15565 [Thermomicrobiales bacterium]|jgi:hypothetical protein|nr:hypothetical protein [Thermomicrobiales bacterium]
MTSAVDRLRANWFVLAVLVVLGAYLGTRIWGIDRMLNTDEPFWLGSSGRMYAGLADFDLGATFQLPHPGQPTLWAGVIAYLFSGREFPVIDNTSFYYHSVHLDLRRLGIDPMEMLIDARIAKLVVQAALLAVSAVLLRRLFGPWVALVALVLLVFEPFQIGHDRFLHIDGMTAIASMAAVLGIGWAAGGSSPGRWVVAGVLTAIAIMARFTVGVLVPIGVLLIVVPAIATVVRGRPLAVRQAAVYRAVVMTLSFGLATGLATVVLWPALLTEPAFVIERMWGFASNAATAGHELPIFYDGRIVEGDPGSRFYVDALAWRMTPVIMAGLVLFVLALPLRRTRAVVSGQWETIATIVLFGAAYFAIMDAGAKKIDRYILPLFPLMNILAAIGIVALAGLVWSRRARWRQGLAVALVVALILPQGAAAWSDRQYGLDYFNPLLGGIDEAQETLQLGWGEGLDQAGEFILAQPGGETAVVRSQNDPTTMLYLMPESVSVTGSRVDNDAAGLHAWATTDYYVSYLPQWRRNLQPVIHNQASRFDPLHEVRIHGVPFASVYDMRTIPPPPVMINSLTCRWDYSQLATLLTYHDRWAGTPADGMVRRDLSLHFQSRTVIPLPVQVRLIPKDAAAGLSVIELGSTLQPAVAPGAVSSVEVMFDIPEGRTTNDYWVDVSLLNPATGVPLQTRLMNSTIEPRTAASATMCAGAGTVD